MNIMQVARALQSHIDDTAGRPSWPEYHGMTPDDIAEAHPHLTLADVHAALAYFSDHREAVVAEWQDRDRLIEACRRKFLRLPYDRATAG